jgi:Thoeris protein ThsB, TIR-like domain
MRKTSRLHEGSEAKETDLWRGEHFFRSRMNPMLCAWVVRNSWVIKDAQGEREVAGFFDSSVFEAKEREGVDALKRFLRDGLQNSTVTCVLVGTRTALSRWVRYEIFRSFIRGNGLLAVRIHTIPDFNKLQSVKGSNPFDNLAFTVDGDILRFKEYMKSGWQLARDVGFMQLSDVAYGLHGKTNHTFSTLFPVYDWKGDDGYKNLGVWIEAAARRAGR